MSLAAAAAKNILWCMYIVALDIPEQEVPFSLHRLMTAVPSVTTTKKLPGILPMYIMGGRVRLTKTLLAPELVPEREGNVLGIELHDCDFNRLQRQAPGSIAEDACCLSEYVAQAIYVKFDDLQVACDSLHC